MQNTMIDIIEKARREPKGPAVEMHSPLPTKSPVPTVPPIDIIIKCLASNDLFTWCILNNGVSSSTDMFFVYRG